ncbi:ABC transporter ATP-binding protein [Phytomonospora endophytica]|uniref:ATP-binding cassette subfamily B multidrug efflux pump n=1 Tax=Phytomonospora endophytica TaxID=714109 RepID=A0A841FU96_9ACTN|nr:ABC transporter ATP-binding protein [Phytomonospora endophytica]MBB6039925.1 ATP-binding cassette subfamily B multidrug efflux pump [Phytomonospora endophytica]GIG71005.1 multidrug ABC transporter ATP-binding protein [Phytomonospora endophytica]
MLRFLTDPINPFTSRVAALPRTAWSFLLREFRPLRLVVAASLVSTVIGASVEVWLIGYSGRLVDSLTATAPPDVWRVHGPELLAVAGLLLVVRPLLHFFSEALDDLAFRSNAEALALWRTHRHVSRQSAGWFRRNLSGRVASLVEGGGQSASVAAYVVIHTLAYVGVYIIGSVWVMSSVDARMALPMALWILLYAGLAAHVIPRYRRTSEHRQEAESELTGLLVDSYGNADTLALFADRAAEDDLARRVMDRTRRSRQDVGRVEVTVNTGMMLLNGVLMTALIGYGIVLWSQEAAPIGLIASALALSFRIGSMAEWLLDGVSSLFSSLGSLRKSLDTAAEPLAVPDDGTDVLQVTEGRIRLSGVHHHYGRGAGGLDGVDLEIRPGERVGLVGRSGAGKSTLVNLILRFFDAEDGRVEIDGRDVTSVTQESLRRAIAMVPQEATLLARTVRANIAHDGTDVEEAAKKASAHGFITALPDGYDTLVGERGAVLSGGQRQRIALARAIRKDAPILVLDEATSALDSEVEAAIQDTLDEVMEGRTVIAIAHRLSTIARMDRIVVLNAGRVAEEGSHDELLVRGGLYASLWARQSGGFLGE